MRTVSVVIPAFDASRFISATLESVLAQTLQPSEIIVVDDGSTDDTGEVAAQLDPRIKVIHQANTGQGGARQTGLNSARGEYLMFLDADDRLMPTALEQLCGRLEEAAGAALAYCRSSVWDVDSKMAIDEACDLDDAKGDVWDKLIVRNFIRTPGCVVAGKNELMKAEGWDPAPEYQGNEDWDLWLRLAEAGSFVRVDEPLLQYSAHAGSYSRKRRSMQKSMLAVYDKQLRRHAGDESRLKIISEGRRNALECMSSELLSASWHAFAEGKPFPGVELLIASISNAPDRLQWLREAANAVGRRAVRRPALH